VVAGVSPALVRFAADTAASTTIGEISLLAVEIIGLLSSHDYFFQSLFHHRPFAAVGIKTGISGCAAARIIGNHVINKIFITGVGKLVRFARLK